MSDSYHRVEYFGMVIHIDREGEGFYYSLCRNGCEIDKDSGFLTAAAAFEAGCDRAVELAVTR